MPGSFQIENKNIIIAVDDALEIVKTNLDILAVLNSLPAVNQRKDDKDQFRAVQAARLVLQRLTAMLTAKDTIQTYSEVVEPVSLAASKFGSLPPQDNLSCKLLSKCPMS